MPNEPLPDDILHVWQNQPVENTPMPWKRSAAKPGSSRNESAAATCASTSPRRFGDCRVHLLHLQVSQPADRAPAPP